MRVIAVCFLVLSVLSGCASIAIDGNQYKHVTPTFDLQRFFTGQVKAWGILQNRSGDVIQRFTVSIDGKDVNGKLVLDEVFDYAVGEGPKTRVWKIAPQQNGSFIGEANDIVGKASGQSDGNALYWGYEMDLPVKGKQYRVSFDDWMWAFDDNTIINRSYIKKFGVTFAEVTIFMQKQP